MLGCHLGNRVANELNGKAGNDTISGGAGDDDLFGDAGDDVLSGETGSDRLQGGPGNDTLYGGLGRDTLMGVSANATGTPGNGSIDTLTGAAEEDTFCLGNSQVVFYADASTATSRRGDYARITDFSVGDTIRWSWLRCNVRAG